MVEWDNLSDETKKKRLKHYWVNHLKTNLFYNKQKIKTYKFCTIPFTQVYNEINGKYCACCFNKEFYKHTIENTTLKEWMIDSEYMNSIRKEMLDPNTDFKQ